MLKIVLVIAGVVIVVVVGAWLLFGPARKIGVSTTSISVAAGGSTTFTATLMAKGWFGSLAATGGTLTPNHGNIITVTPRTATTTAAAPNATFTVNGVVAGTGRIIMNGSSAGGTHDVAEISVTVTGG